jgi:hypothetical protein
VADWDWSRVVFDHVKIGVSDADESKRFYITVLAELDIPPLWETERGAQYANLVISDAAELTGPLHIGFVARSRDEVDAFHRAGIEAGSAPHRCASKRPIERRHSTGSWAIVCGSQAQTMSGWNTLRSSGTSFVSQARVSRSTIS